MKPQIDGPSILGVFCPFLKHDLTLTPPNALLVLRRPIDGMGVWQSSVALSFLPQVMFQSPKGTCFFFVESISLFSIRARFGVDCFVSFGCKRDCTL